MLTPEHQISAPAPNPPWRITAAARQIGISRRSLERRIADGSVRSIRIGCRVLIPDSVVRRIAEYGLEITSKHST